MAKSADSFNRKSKYNAVIYKSDYFVIKHLEVFLTNSVNTYIRDGMVVADIGCGEQPLRDLVESKGGKYIGIDISQNTKKNIDVIASITNIPLEDNVFDCILCTEVLEHVPDTHSAFVEMKRLMKINGHLIITTPFCYPLHEEPYDYVRLTHHCMLAEATANNLSVVSIQKSGNELEAIATILSNMLRPINSKSFIVTIYYLPFRLIINTLTSVISYIFRKLLPCKTYLNNFIILEKTSNTIDELGYRRYS